MQRNPVTKSFRVGSLFDNVTLEPVSTPYTNSETRLNKNIGRNALAYTFKNTRKNYVLCCTRTGINKIVSFYMNCCINMDI